MKTHLILTFVFVTLILSQSEASGDDKTADTESNMALVGERLLDSLKDDNLVGFSQCWMPSSIAFKWSKHPPAGVPRPSAKWIESLKPRMLKRDRLIASFYKPLREELVRISGGDLSNLSFDSVTGTVSKMGELRRVDKLTVTLKVDTTTSVQLIVEDGIEFDGVWYISDDVLWLNLLKNGELQRRVDFKRQVKQQD